MGHSEEVHTILVDNSTVPGQHGQISMLFNSTRAGQQPVALNNISQSELTMLTQPHCQWQANRQTPYLIPFNPYNMELELKMNRLPSQWQYPVQHDSIPTPRYTSVSNPLSASAYAVETPTSLHNSPQTAEWPAFSEGLQIVTPLRLVSEESSPTSRPNLNLWEIVGNPSTMNTHHARVSNDHLTTPRKPEGKNGVVSCNTKPIPTSTVVVSNSGSASANSLGPTWSRRASTSLAEARTSFLLSSLSKPFKCPKANCGKSYKQAYGKSCI